MVLTVSVAETTRLRDIDFKNFSFPWDDDEMAESTAVPPLYRWISPLPKSSIRALKGLHHFYEPDQDPLQRERARYISIDSVIFGDLDKDGIEEAAVHLNYSTGGTANWDFLYIYKLVHGQPRLVGILESGSRGYGGLGRISIQDDLLILDFADGERRVGDCCSEGYIRVRYRWRKGAFVEEGPRERGDLNIHEH
jgi:hypothetical protein